MARDTDTPPPPIACTLEPSAVPERLAAWARLAEQAVERHDTDTGARLVLPRDIDAPAVAALVAAEQECCAFLTFRMTWDARATTLEIDAPPDARAIIGALFAPSS